MLLRQTLKQTLSQKVDPKMIMANEILACSTLELTQQIEQELADNPALESPDEDLCTSCSLPKEICPDCPMKPQKQQTEEPDDTDWREWYAADVETRSDSSHSLDDPDFDPIANLGIQRTLHDHLIELLRPATNEHQFRIAEYLVGNINPEGYLDATVEDASMDLAVTIEDVEETLAIVQSFDPPGVGARSLQECLLIQLKSLEESGEGNALALKMVKDYWPDTAARRVSRLAHLTHAPQRAVSDALDFIRDSLKPYPGEGYRDPWDPNRDNSSTVQPDVIVYRTVAGYEIEVVTSDYQQLGINSQYRDAYAKIRNGGSKSYSDDERKHVTEYVERADNFIKSIAQRRRTLKAISTYVVEFHQGYIETGQRSFLRPLTRTQVGRALKIHESTVSRATAGKFMRLPSEEVVSFDLFFDGANSVKDIILDMIHQEDKANPLSDQDIADILKERGLNVARRTVVKYRESQNILSSRQRRRSA